MVRYSWRYSWALLGLLVLLGHAEVGLAERTYHFEEYKYGQDNRPLFQRVVAEMEERYGAPVDILVGDWFESHLQFLTMGVKELEAAFRLIDQAASHHFDEEDQPYFRRRYREISGRFYVAHEYFHSFLQHSRLFEAVMGQLNQRELRKARRQIEYQADYLAALHVLSEGFGLDGVFMTMVMPHDENYPSPWNRLDRIVSAGKDSFRYTLFGDPINCANLVLAEIDHATLYPRDTELIRTLRQWRRRRY